MNSRLRRRFIIVVALVVFSVVAVKAADVPIQSSIPTDELDVHYLGVPKAESYTYAMLELGIRMGAASSAALSDDTTSADEAIASFKEEYQLVAAMVPSWRKYFDSTSIDDLSKAVKDGAGKAAKKKLVDSIQNSCTACHARFMVPVQARYRWGKFSRISIDSDSGQPLEFHTIMVDLSNSLGGLRGDVEQGKFKAALAQYDRAKERFTMMELACTACHDQPREYFIDSRVKGHLLRIGGLLRKGSQDTAEYTSELNAINEASCLPCHQVHMPAAFLQQYWESTER